MMLDDLRRRLGWLMAIAVIALIAALSALALVGCRAAGVSQDTEQKPETTAATDVATGDNSTVFVLTWQKATASAQYGGYGMLAALWINSVVKRRRAEAALDRVLGAVEAAKAVAVKQRVRERPVDRIEAYIRHRLRRITA